MENPTLRLVAPALLRVDFRDAYWDISRRQVGAWLALVVLSDLAVQWATGTLSLLSGMASLLAPLLLGGLPSRLSGALAGLYVTQALVSWALVAGLSARQVDNDTLLVGSTAWQLWCMGCLIVLVVRYIQTPKAQMRVKAQARATQGAALPPLDGTISAAPPFRHG